MSKQYLVKSAFWLTIAEVIFLISGYIVHAGVGRILGPADYGRYGLVITLTTMIIIFIGNGIPTAMSKFISEIFESKPGMVRAIKRQSAILQIILIGALTIVFFLLAPLIALVLRDPSLTPLFRISTFIIPAFAAAGFYVYYFIGIHKFHLQAILNITRSLAKIGFIITMALLFRVEGSISGYIFAPLTVFILAFAIDKIWIDKKFPTDKKLVFPWQKIIKFAWPVTLFMLFYETLISLSLYMVKGILQDDFSTGIYNSAITIGRIPNYIFYALAIMILPTISKINSNEGVEKTSNALSATLRILLILLAPMIVLMIAFSQEIVPIFYGARFAAASEPMQILTAGIGILTIFYVISFAFNGIGKVKIPMAIALAGLALSAALNFILISEFGVMGAAYATAIASVFVTAIILFFVKYFYRKLVSIKTFARVIFAAFAILVFSSWFPHHSWLFIVWSIILFSIYLFILYIFNEIKKDDLLLLKSLFKKS